MWCIFATLEYSSDLNCIIRVKTRWWKDRRWVRLVHYNKSKYLWFVYPLYNQSQTCRQEFGVNSRDWRGLELRIAILWKEKKKDDVIQNNNHFSARISTRILIAAGSKVVSIFAVNVGH